MAKPKAGENSKKAQGQARKAEAAAGKQRQAEEAAEAAEAADWESGAKKGNKKQADQEAKREEAARKKAERDAELAAEEASLESKPKASKNKGRDKILAKKSSGRGGIDSALASSEPGLSAHGIDDAIAALELTTGKNSSKVDRHPERRFKAALKDYEDRNLDRLREEHPGLRLNQMKEILYKEFQKAPENPFNQVNADYNASQADIKEIRHSVRKAKEDVLRER